MIEDELNIFRLVWHKFDFEPDGRLKGAAFSKADLLPKFESDGSPKFVSTNLATKISKESVDWRMRSQQGGGKDVKFQRIEARFVELNCEQLRSVHRGGTLQLEATAEPDPAGTDGPGSPENPAHCALRHVSGTTGSNRALDSHVDFLRSELLKQILEIHPYRSVFASAE